MWHKASCLWKPGSFVQGPRRVHGNLVRAGGFPAPPLLPDAEGPVLGPHVPLWAVAGLELD